MNRLRSNDACWCGSRRKYKRCHGDHQRFRRPPVEPGVVSPRRDVPARIARPEYVDRPRPSGPAGLQVHGERELQRLRHAGQVAAEVLATAGAAVAPGVTTDELDQVAHDTYVRLGAYPSDLGYKGYPKSVCTSVNEVVCHGIPDSRPLRRGDIVNIDVTAYVEGMHGDTSATFVVGEVDEPTAALVELTRSATLAAIAALAPGAHLGVVGETIEPFAAAHGLHVVRDWGGHGIGATFHAAPHVNHTIERGRTVVLEPGLTFTVEPMINAGTASYHLWPDDWTVATDDLLPSAQFEHTVVVTESGVEIVTLTAEGTSPAGTLETAVIA